MTIIDDSLKQILDKVRKPARYIGKETNSIRKEHTPSRVKIALSYPDLYEIGMSYLGLRILYHLLNEDDEIVCERVFAPWPDLEEELTFNKRKLFSLESKIPIDKFDILGFSLSYELTFTNVLNMLHLSGISVRSKDRSDDEPIVIAGGACSYNPEPMAEFIDCFLIGDAEESILRFVKEYRELKNKGLDRKNILRSLSKIPGVYVPALYDAKYAGDNFLGLEPIAEGVPERIQKGMVEDFENAYYPVKQIVPLTRIVHDRLAVEVMRGCPNRCRFCQASSINRPVRLRSPEKVRDLCKETYKNTGYEQIALLSLSSVNYPHLKELVKGLTEDFVSKGVGVSIPSLRVDEAFYGLPEMLSAIKKAGLTFAPEAASGSLRSSIGKDIDLKVLCKSAEVAYKHGWRRLKLYFMVGFSENMQDEAQNIGKIARELSNIKRSVSKGAAEVKVSVNPFIPKPHTPFQWLGMAKKDTLKEVKRDLLSNSSRKISIEFNDIEKSFLECCLSRGDRRMSRVIYSAWENGAKMDSWDEYFNISAWKGAFASHDINIEEVATKRYSLDDVLPWSHIDIGISPEKLKKDLLDSGL